MATSLWFRCYTEIKRDRKLRRLPPEHRWVWVVLMALAKESPLEGQLLISEDIPLTIDDIADEAAVEPEDAAQAIERFKEQNMLYEEDGVFVLANWDKRQFVSDTSTDRVRKHRQRKDETLQECFINGDETPPEAEAESRDQKQNTETEKEEEGPVKPETSSSPSPSNQERECMQILNTIPSYPFDYRKDIEQLRSLAVDFPTVDILKELKKWKVYKLDHPLKKKSNPRLQLRRWFENAQKWNKDERASPALELESEKAKFEEIYLT